jgi:NAD+ diphosphatase
VAGLPYRIDGPLALARSGLDRAAERRRDEHWWAAVRASVDARALALAGSQFLAAADGSGRQRLVLQPGSSVPGDERYLLGVAAAGTVHVAVRLTDQAAVAALRADPRATDLRRAGAALDDQDAGLLVHAVALAEWHARHERCARCGAGTEVRLAGHLRRCPSCGVEHFPRTDPAVIVLVVDDADRALLGRQRAWPAGRFSTLAGFVEPGESPEQALVREVAEETGVRVAGGAGDLVYAGSQPWPFPSSLMLGFFARAASTTITVDGDELAEARWFSRDALAAELRTGSVHVPPPVSIARRLIEGWFGGPLPGQERWR